MNHFRIPSCSFNWLVGLTLYPALLVLTSGCQPAAEPGTSKGANSSNPSSPEKFPGDVNPSAATMDSTKVFATESADVATTLMVNYSSLTIDQGSSSVLDESDSNQEPPLAVSLDEVIKRIDLRTLPTMPGNLRHSATLGNYYLSLAPTEENTIDHVIEYLDVLLIKSGCKRSELRQLESTDKRHPMRFYQHGSLLLEAGASQVDGYNGPEIVSYIIDYGNLDLRQYTWPTGANVTWSKPNSVQITIKADVMELRKHFSEYFQTRQWQEFQDYIPGIKIPLATQLPHQKFIQNGVVLSLYHRDGNEELARQNKFGSGELTSLISVSLAELEPVLPGSVSSLKIRFSPLAMVYETALLPKEIQMQLEKLYVAKGYQPESVDPPEDDSFHLRYQHPTQPTLDIEFKTAGETTLVVVNEAKS